MEPQAPEPSGSRGDWGYPVISLHESAQSLVTALLPYGIDMPAIDTAPPSLPAGALLLSAPTGLPRWTAWSRHWASRCTTPACDLRSSN